MLLKSIAKYFSEERMEKKRQDGLLQIGFLEDHLF